MWRSLTRTAIGQARPSPAQCFKNNSRMCPSILLGRFSSSAGQSQGQAASSFTPHTFKSTLGPDASNPTTIAQPTFTKSGQLLRVNVTEAAAAKLHLVSEQSKRPDLVLRIQVESGGCHGFQYIFKLPDASEITTNDSVFERDGSRVVVDHKSLRILRDATIDYATELIGSQFKVTSPHTSSSCGCGSSFSLDMED